MVGRWPVYDSPRDDPEKFVSKWFFHSGTLVMSIESALELETLLGLMVETCLATRKRCQNVRLKLRTTSVMVELYAAITGVVLSEVEITFYVATRDETKDLLRAVNEEQLYEIAATEWKLSPFDADTRLIETLRSNGEL